MSERNARIASVPTRSVEGAVAIATPAVAISDRRTYDLAVAKAVSAVAAEDKVVEAGAADEEVKVAEGDCFACSTSTAMESYQPRRLTARSPYLPNLTSTKMEHSTPQN